MTRVIVIGPSHVSAFKNAWREISGRYPGVTMEFFGAPMQVFLKMRLAESLVFGLDPRHRDDERVEIVEQINGALTIDLAGADIVVRVGHHIMDEDLLTMLLDHDVDGLREAGGAGRMSAACFDAMLDALAEHALPPPRWRGWSGPKMAIAPRPLPAETLIGQEFRDRPRLSLHARVAERPEGARAALTVFNDRIADTLETAGVAYLRQPESTIVDPGLTRAEFVDGATRIISDARFGANDHIHMNAAYGALCIEQLFAEFGVAA